MMPRSLRYLLLVIVLAGTCYAPGLFNVAAGTVAPELLDFGASWCEPCQRMEPVLKQLEQGGYRVIRLDRDKQPAVFDRFGITTMPTFVAMYNGRETERLQGMQTAAELKSLLDRAAPLPPGVRTHFRARGDFEPAFLQQAEAVANHKRRELALEWLGYELPDWDRPCDLKLVNMQGDGGSTSFYTAPGYAGQFNMTVQGSRQGLLNDVLPHEVLHTVLASHFHRHLPRWADEGACTYAETPASQAKMRAMLIDYLQTGRGIPTQQMLAMSEYPADQMPLYAQGFSLTSFLVEANGQQGFIAFLEDALAKGWESAFQVHYEYSSLDELQATWLEWVRAGSPKAPFTAAFRGCGQCYRWRPLKRLWEKRAGFVFPRSKGSRLPPPKAPADLAQQPPAAAQPDLPLAPVSPPPVSWDQNLETPKVEIPGGGVSTAPAPDTTLGDRLAELEKKKQAVIDGLQARLNEALAEAAKLKDKAKQAIEPPASIDTSSPAATAATGAATWLTTHALMALGLSAGPAGLASAVIILLARRKGKKLRAQVAQASGQAWGKTVAVLPITHDNQPAEPLVARSREFVEIEKPSLALEALQFAMDDYVKRNPGSRLAIEAIESVAKQYESGLRKAARPQ